MEKTIHVTMLGKFTIDGPGLPRARVISLSARSRRLWVLVVYLILNRERGVPAQELIDWLWPGTGGQNPTSTLQNNISRSRNALGELGLEDGKRLIYNNAGTYFWAPDRQTVVDWEVFTQQAQAALNCPTRAQAMDLAVEAARLYTGDFLPECAGEPWRDARSESLRALYRELVTQAVPWLLEAGRYPEAAELSGAAEKWMPTDQTVAALQMQALRLDGRPEVALKAYERLTAALEGTRPDASVILEKEQAALAQTAVPEESDRLLHALVNGEDIGSGAMECDNTVFREFVRRQLRDLRRGGEAQMVSLRVEEQDPGIRMAAMERMGETIRRSLRGGDPFTRSGMDLYLVLLPGATRENGEMIAERVLSRYYKDLPEGYPAFVHQVLDLNGDEV